MSRNLEFKRPAIITIVSTALGAATAISCALAGFGIWTLVAAPIVIFWSRAICLVFATRFFMWPSFSFKGAGQIFNFGFLMLLTQMFWVIQSQSDIFIAGRVLDPHKLGLYAEAIFLTQLFAGKFVPPLNEVAFPAYSRMQKDKHALAQSFLKAVRLILLIFCPLYLGMSVTAGPFVETLFGPKWVAIIPMVELLALAMPFMTLQILFAPANNALGRPRISVINGCAGAIIMTTAFLIAIRYGEMGLVYAWLAGMPILMVVTFMTSRLSIGITAMELCAAVAPGLGCAVAMAVIVYMIRPFVAGLHSPAQLAILSISGGCFYAVTLRLVSRKTFNEVVDLVFRRKSQISGAV